MRNYLRTLDDPELRKVAYFLGKGFSDEAVAAAIRYSAERIRVYGDRIAAYVKEGMSVEDEPVSLARRLICEEGCGMPDKLFLALHTVSEHLKERGEI